MGVRRPQHGGVMGTTWVCLGLNVGMFCVACYRLWGAVLVLLPLVLNTLCPNPYRNLLQLRVVQTIRRTNLPLRPYSMQKQCVYRQRTGSVRSLIVIAERIQNKLEADPAYAAIVPSPAEVKVLISQLFKLWQEIALRNYQRKIVKDKKRKELDMALAQQCKWINGMANGDLDFLTGTGFGLSKSRELTHEPLETNIRNIQKLEGGVAILNAYNVKHARVYEARVTGPNGFIKQAISFSAKIQVDGLPVGVMLEVSVRSYNHRGHSYWCNTTKFALPISSSDSGASDKEIYNE